MIYAIKTHKLCKNYKKVVALHNVDISVPIGKIYGLIGPNGAGKTTLIKLLCGLLRPTSGFVKVLGLDPVEEALQLTKLIGYMPQNPALYEDLSIKDNVGFFAEAMDIMNTKTEVTDILNFVELSHRKNDKVYKLSGGLKKRVSFACTLVHKPKILFLDEPTAAIDPDLKAKTWKLFRKLANQGNTIFVSTHMMEEAINCDQIAIVIGGRVVTIITPSAYREKGMLKLKITYKKGKELNETIMANPKKLAIFLKALGLDGDIKTVEIEEEGLEKILFKMINEIIK